MEKEPETVKFELENEEYDSTEEAEEDDEEEEPHTPILRRSSWERRKLERYSPLNFHSTFSLSITDDVPRNMKDVVDSEDSDLWKKTMIEEIDSFQTKKSWDIV